MTLFEALIVSHLIGDWLLQTEWQAQNKSHNWRALLVHLVIYHAIVFLVLYLGFELDVYRIVTVVAVLAVSHALLDRRRAVLGLMRFLRIAVKREPERWLVIAVDQTLHVVLLAMATVVLTL